MEKRYIDPADFKIPNRTEITTCSRVGQRVYFSVKMIKQIN